MKRILIVINKNWESDAALAALFNPDFKSDLPVALKGFWGKIKSSKPNFPYVPPEKDAKPSPSVIFTLDDINVEVWCLNNIMTPNPDENNTYYFSYSGQKAKDMAKITGYSTDQILLVAAFGTAGISSELTKNGSVLIGSRIFPYDAGTAKAPWRYDSKSFGTIVDSSVSKSLFDSINVGLSSVLMKYYFDTGTLTTPQSPSNAFQVIADKDVIAVGDMNTNSYDDFAANDQNAVKLCKAYLKSNNLPNTQYHSVETTHGIIRMEIPCDNFIFISAITDRFKYFDNEVTPKVRAQNFSAAFNGGIFLNWFVPFCLNGFSENF